MKCIIASEIHCSSYFCKKLIEKFNEEKADRLLLLGDILYHGPRNDLPKEYNPKEVIKILNELADKIVCVRGNCDAEVDQMVLKFPIMADYTIIDLGQTLIYATHGHIFNEENPLPVAKNSVMICGHFHVPAARQHENYLYLNTGSISLPKENSWNSYIIFDGKTFIWKDLESNKEMLNIPLKSNY